MMNRIVAALMCIGFLTGCSSLDGTDAIVKPVANWAISACETCRPGSECTLCCHACKLDKCYDFCQEYPHQCDDCEDIEYWICLDYNCVQRH